MQRGLIFEPSKVNVEVLSQRIIAVLKDKHEEWKIPDDEIGSLADTLLPEVINFFSSDKWRAEFEGRHYNLDVLAKDRSVWCGYEYYDEEYVKNLKETDKGVFTAEVLGKARKHYVVTIDVNKPETSTCSCPYADGNHTVCKHMVATYFTAYPEEAEKYYRKYVEPIDEATQLYDQVVECVKKMKKDELRRVLFKLLFEVWTLDDFLSEYIE